MVKMFKEKVFKNKRLMRWASLAFAVALVVTVAPYIQHAWGEGGGDPAETQTIPEATPISEYEFDENEPLVVQETEDAEEVADAGISVMSDEGVSVQSNTLTSVEWTDNKAKVGSTETIDCAPIMLTSGGPYELTVDGTLKTRIEVGAGVTLNLKGSGTIDGTGKGGSVILVKGKNAKLVLNEDKKDDSTKGAGLKIVGGTGTAFEDLDEEMFGNDPNKTATVGGGIQVRRGSNKETDRKDVAELEIWNGTIGKEGVDQGNSAQAGGGIFIDRNCKFTMHNGAVVGNTATKHEGGGIFLAGGTVYSPETNFTKDNQGNWKEGPKPYKFDKDYKAKIEKAKIADNRTQTTVDWGGGGLFIESKGDLKVGNVAVTKNHADGLGGGISGCPHAKMGIGKITSGAAIFGNTADKSTRPNDSWLYDMTQGGKYTSASSKTGDIIAYTKDNAGFDKLKAQDFYCTKASIVYGSSICTWSGRVAYFDEQIGEDGQRSYGFNVDIATDGELSVSNATLGLTATLVGTPNVDGAAVQIKNNSSTTHGGGIGCNGTIEIGTLNNEPDTNDWSLKLTKEFKDYNNDKVTPGTYTFGLYKSADENDPYQVGGKNVTATNSANGEIAFKDMLSRLGKGEGTHTFYVKEVVPANADKYVEYDTAWREVTVTVKKDVTTATVWPNTKTTTTYYIPDDGKTVKVQNAQGEFVSSDSGDTFVNTAKTEYKNSVTGEGVLEFTKEYTGPTNNSVLSDKTQFTYKMYRAKDVDGTLQPDEDALIAETSNNAKGEIKFNFKNSQAADTDLTQSPEAKDTVLVDMYQGIDNITKAEKEAFDKYKREITVFVKEKKGSIADDSQTTYDESWRKVTLTFQPEKVASTPDRPNPSWNGNKLQPVETTAYKAKMTVSYAKQGQDGNYSEGDDGKVFKNYVWAKTENRLNGSGTLTLEKAYLTGVEGKDIIDDNLEGAPTKTFTFNMYAEKDGEPDTSAPIATATNDAKGKIVFNFKNDRTTDMVQSPESKDTVLVNMYPGLDGVEDVNEATDAQLTQARTITVYIQEKDDATNTQTDFDTDMRKVTVTFQPEKQIDDPLKYENVNNNPLTPVRVDTYNVTMSVSPFDGETFVNQWNPQGSIQLAALKGYYGADTNAKFEFDVQRLEVSEKSATDLATDGGGDLEVKLFKNDDEEEEAYTGVASGFNADGEATISFPEMTFTEDTAYWFAISEKEANGVTDPRVYVVKIPVNMSEDGMKLIPDVEGIEVYCAENGVQTQTMLLVFSSQVLQLTKLNGMGGFAVVENNGQEVTGQQPSVVFGNFDSAMAVAGYSIYAASMEPVDRTCFVDPKIIKELKAVSDGVEAPTMKADQFTFDLIEITPKEGEEVNWGQESGPVISHASNDRYGMVDFDKANNVSGDWENPSCLAYTQPGTYYYRVVEDKAQVKVPSIIYSDEIITFTTVIEEQEVDGKPQLVCTKMEYGKAEPNGDGTYTYTALSDALANTDYHPTMTNKIKGMDLQVRKTSALDLNKGLEGATYGLYAVNDGAQGDIFMGEATSDADGWITFKDVNLTSNTLYYFKEREAPAGHTVSEFRSDYFYLEPANGGFSLVITDKKVDFANQADVKEVALSAMSEDGEISIQSDDNAIATLSDTTGNILLTFANDNGIGVFDEATNVEFTKLDTRTHEWVEGAKLQILEKNGGKVIDSWVSGKAPEKLQGKLNVDTEYILREIEAPEGYAKADDVVFKIGQYGSVEIVSGTSNGNASISGETISLYDTMLDGENLITEYRETPGEDGEGSFLAKTGDILKIAGIVILAIAAICGIVFAVRRRNKSQA